MDVAFTKHALARMARDALAEAEVLEALDHATHAPRPARCGRTLGRRVHAHGIVSVLFEQHPQGTVVVSCWRSIG